MPRRTEIEDRADFEEIQEAWRPAELPWPGILPSGEAALDRRERAARDEAARIAAERQFLGKLATAELLRQSRPEPAPRASRGRLRSQGHPGSRGPYSRGWHLR